MPQGSHLGPLLFILFINDLPSIFDSSVEVLLFADDAKILSIVRSPEDTINLQSNLDRFANWSRHNRLPLNISKRSVITFSRLDNAISYNYKIDNCVITRVNFVRDLGIVIESNFSFSIHINTIIKKAFKMLGFINRSTETFKNLYTFKTLFFSLVRSHLEFGSVVWSPSYSSFKEAIEKVQYKFLKLICFKLNIPVTSSLQNSVFGFTSCNLRRNVANIMFLFDLLNGLVDSPELLSMIGFITPNRYLRKPNLFHIPFYKNNYSSASFFLRALSLCNAIAVHIDFFFISRDLFKQNVYLGLSLAIN